MAAPSPSSSSATSSRPAGSRLGPAARRPAADLLQPGPRPARPPLRRPHPGAAVRLRRGPDLHDGLRGPTSPSTANDLSAPTTSWREVTLTNTGERPAHEVVQAYVTDVVTSVTWAAKELKAFRRVVVPPGQSVTVESRSRPRPAPSSTPPASRVVEPGDFELLVGPSSRDADLLRAPFTVTPSPCHRSMMRAARVTTLDGPAASPSRTSPSRPRARPRPRRRPRGRGQLPRRPHEPGALPDAPRPALRPGRRVRGRRARGRRGQRLQPRRPRRRLPRPRRLRRDGRGARGRWSSRCPTPCRSRPAPRCR